ncbi:hypothetical protein [Mesorhizobium sp. M0909]
MPSLACGVDDSIIAVEEVRLRIPLTTPPTLAAAMVKALGVS